MVLRNKRILVTGGAGFIGKHVIQNLVELRHVDPGNIIVPRQKTDDIRFSEQARRLIRDNSIDVVIHLAALVGGVGYSSTHPATQYYNNVLMDLQIVEASRRIGVEKVVLVSSSCAYPEKTTYPMKEEALWDGLPQETNLEYGIAKRIELVQALAYRKQYGLNVVVVVPNNAYGPGDNFDPEYSHVIPALIKKCLNQEDPLTVWGDGTPTRDFLYVKDFAEGVICAAENLETGEPVNLGSGTETSIRDLVSIIQRATNHTGNIIFDKSKPNGQPRRSVDISRAKKLLGFNPQWKLEDGITETVSWYKNNEKEITARQKTAVPKAER